MGHGITVVDASSPAAIAEAIEKVDGTPGLRIKPGIDALWVIFKAPNHSLRRTDLVSQFRALDLHFGWFCKHVAIELGAQNPDVLALVNQTTDDQGYEVLTLKPSVTAAMGSMSAAKNLG